MTTQRLSPDVREALGRLARSSDRTSPSVFVGRTAEIALIDSAVQMTRRGEVGHTVVIQGVPGAGKTALLREYGRRLLANSGEGGWPVVPVPLRPTDLDASPAAILEEVDRQFCEFETTGKWGEPMNRMIQGASFVGSTLFAAFTKRDLREFAASARAPSALSHTKHRVSAFAGVRARGALLDGVQAVLRENATKRRMPADAPIGWQPEAPQPCCARLKYARYAFAGRALLRNFRLPLTRRFVWDRALAPSRLLSTTTCGFASIGATAP